ncbi:MAG: hypothetical protein ACPGED_08985, partial [Flavobacteriales bacterium]
NLFFIPYYAFAITSIFGHVSAVHSKKMKATIFGLNPAKQAYGILALGIIATFVLIYGLCNGFTGFTIPSEYEIMIGK